MTGLMKKAGIAGAMGLTLAAGMTALPNTADAFRAGFRVGGFHGGFGRGYGYGYGRGFGYRGFGYRGFGYRAYGYRGYGPGFYGFSPYWGGYRCGPYRRFYGACRYRYGY